MYQASYDPKTQAVVLSKDNAHWFSIPAAFSVNGICYTPDTFSQEGDTLIFRTETSCLSFQLLPDSILVDVELTCPRETPIYETVYFLGNRGGMDIGHFDRAFSPQPRRNNGHNLDFFQNLPGGRYHDLPDRNQLSLLSIAPGLHSGGCGARLSPGNPHL